MRQKSESGVVVFFVAGTLAGCATPPKAPALPTPTTIQMGNADISQLNTDPVQTFHDGVRIARAACMEYLNQEAQQAAGASQLGIGAGALGAGLSAVNPLAGVASSLFQTFLTGFRAAGAMPYTSQTSTLVLGAMNAYEASVGVPPDNDTAVSWVDDVAFDCTPAGYAMLVNAAISTANVGVQQVGHLAAIDQAEVASSRPVVTVNGRPVP